MGKDEQYLSVVLLYTLSWNIWDFTTPHNPFLFDNSKSRYHYDSVFLIKKILNQEVNTKHWKDDLLGHMTELLRFLKYIDYSF